MKKFSKSTLSIILSIITCLTMFSCLGLTASAYEIEDFDFLCPGFAPGKGVADAVPYPTTSSATVTAYKWYDKDNNEVTSGTFDADKEYQIRIRLDCKDGVTFNSACDVKFQKESVSYFKTLSSGKTAYIYSTLCKPYNLPDLSCNWDKDGITAGPFDGAYYYEFVNYIVNSNGTYSYDGCTSSKVDDDSKAVNLPPVFLSSSLKDGTKNLFIIYAENQEGKIISKQVITKTVTIGEKGALPATTRTWWEGTTLHWEPVNNATGYHLFLRYDDGKLAVNKFTENTYYDFYDNLNYRDEIYYCDIYAVDGTFEYSASEPEESEHFATYSYFTVNFNTCGHGTAPASQTGYFGQTITDPGIIKADGYALEGWYTDSACKNKFDFSTHLKVNAITFNLYAKWIPLELKVPSGVSVDYRYKVSMTVNCNYIPYGAKIQWYDGNSKIEGATGATYTTGELKESHTYYAKVVDENGTPLMAADGTELSGQINVNVNTSFIKKIVAFFKGLFGGMPTTYTKK